jgi:RecA-family ATPase
MDAFPDMGTAKAKAAGHGGAPHPFRIVNPTTLAGLPVPRREWIVEDWIPAGVVTLLYGDGGTGKTLLAQQLMTSCAAKKPWCGRMVTECRSFGLFCEDDERELHRRQENICLSLGVEFTGLDAMRWVSGVGADNTLAQFTFDGLMTETKLWARFEEAVREFGARLVVIDTAADTFDGNENNRGQVRRFLNKLGGLAYETNGAVLVCAHPSRAGLAAGTSGASTGWINTGRSGLFLERPKPTSDGTEPDPDLRILARRKANYSSIGETIELRWSDGTLLPAGAEGTYLDRMGRAQRAEETFLGLLDRTRKEGQPVSHKTRAGNYAPKFFASRPGRDGITLKEFETAMQALFIAAAIRVEQYKTGSRHEADRIART